MAPMGLKSWNNRPTLQYCCFFSVQLQNHPSSCQVCGVVIQKRRRGMSPLAVMCFHTRPSFLLSLSLQWFSADKSRFIQGSTRLCHRHYLVQTLGHRIGGCLVQHIEIQATIFLHTCVPCHWYLVICLTLGHSSHYLNHGWVEIPLNAANNIAGLVLIWRGSIVAMDTSQTLLL